MVLIFGLKYGVTMEKCFLGKISEETEILVNNQLEELKNDDEGDNEKVKKLMEKVKSISWLLEKGYIKAVTKDDFDFEFTPEERELAKEIKEGDYDPEEEQVMRDIEESEQSAREIDIMEQEDLDEAIEMGALEKAYNWLQKEKAEEFGSIEKWELLNGKKLRLEGER